MKLENEATIIINDRVLNNAQSRTVRVALNSFAMTLKSEGLGADSIGENICNGYLNRIGEILKILEKR